MRLKRTLCAGDSAADGSSRSAKSARGLARAKRHMSVQMLKPLGALANHEGVRSRPRLGPRPQLRHRLSSSEFHAA